MATPIRVPRVGQAAEDATLVEWVRAAGDVVAAGDAVAVVETDKTEIEVESPVAGVIGVLRAFEGDIYPIGAVLVYVVAPGETEPDLDSAPSAAPMAASAPVRPAAGRVAVSPRARRLAEARGVDLADLAGTGPDGLVTERDVEARASASFDLWHGRRVRRRRRLESLRARTARHLSETWSTTPHFVQMVDVDMTTAVALHEASGVTYTELMVAALARSLVDHPHLNAAYDAGDLVEFDEINIAIAVDTARGLDVPVVRHADRLDLDSLRAASRDVVARAQADQLTADDRGGASATVSNLGAHGVKAGTPVLNGPESVLAFMGAVEPRPVVRGEAVVVRATMTLSCAFDHRVVDGVAAAAFVASVKSMIETGDRLG
jgi:pyruvate/2-oxoglutarate dehydrogenase complex dihydrolipoamide acyltransferase (E2) component